MHAIDTLITARWIVPVVPTGVVLERHAVAVHNGRILAVLPVTEAETTYTPAQRHDLGEHLLIPGLVNAHGHASMALLRGIADDLALMDWLQNHIWPAEGRWVSPPFIRDGAELAVAEMIRCGTTCFNDMYFYADEVARVASSAGMRGVMGLIVIDFPTAWAQNADDYLHKALTLYEQFKGNPLITAAFAPHAPYTVSDGPLEKVAMYAEELDIPIHMHVHETAFECLQSEERFGMRPLARLDALGLLTPRLLAVHMTQLTDAEIARIAQAGVHVAHCPESNLKLASGFCPVAKLQAAEVNLCLGTDGAASNNDLDMLGELRSAALLAKGVAGDPTAMPAHAALEMATLGGARALGLEREIGSIEPGKAADLAAIDMSALTSQPLYNPVSQLVYATGREQVSDVWVAGKRLLKSGQLTTLDEQAILTRTHAWREKIQAADQQAH